MDGLSELRWLARQRHPMWGGHLERGEPLNDPGMKQWIADGIIAVSEGPPVGYVITDKGRAAVTANAGDKDG